MGFQKFLRSASRFFSPKNKAFAAFRGKMDPSLPSGGSADRQFGSST